MSADLAAIASDPGILERSADPAVFIIESCERAKAWLAGALEHGDIDQIAEVKSQAEAIRVYTMSKQLGKDAVLSATEIVRRAERGIGVLIRRGQEVGAIDENRRGRPKNFHQSNNLPRPSDFASKGELHGSSSRQPGIYDLTDNVSNGQFEQVIGDARAEGNLSRANVVRKIRREPPKRRRSQQVAPLLDHRITQLRGTLIALEHEIRDGIDESVTPEMAAGWADDLTQVIRPLTRLRTALKEKANG